MSIFHNTGNGWHAVERWPYDVEATLEAFLLDHPMFIPSDRADTWTVWAQQIASRADNQLDMLGIASDGSITIVECKLGRNREERREVVAQVLEYAAGLWQMGLEQFIELFQAKYPDRTDPFDLLQQSKPIEARDSDWDIEEVRRVAAENLRTGKFRLIVAVDEISDRLARIVDYVNERGRGELKLVAISFPRFGEDGAGVVAPVVHGDLAPAPSNRTSQALNPSIEQVLASALPEVLPIVRELHGFLAGDARGPLVARANRLSISYDGKASDGTRVILQLYPIAGSKDGPSSAGLFIDRRAMEALGTSTDHVISSLIAVGGARSGGSSILLREADASRLDRIEDVLDAEVLRRIDG